MGSTLEQKEWLQWHPAFYAGLQIELKEEADRLIFENEHQLGTKPKEIDVLIIKKEPHYSVKKNLGRIFKTYNIIEYKNPMDYLSVDDFYRVYGYTCFYKADTGSADSIPIGELTISLVCRRYPRKLSLHLAETLGYTIHRQEPGIYYISGDKFPIQFIITSQLSEQENLWLKSLTNGLKQTPETERLISEYQKHKNNPLYESVMDIVIRANRNTFEEENTMCAALEELFEKMMHDKLEAMKHIMRNDLENQVRSELENQVRSELENQVRSELENQVRSELKNQVRNELRDEIKNEIANKLELNHISLIQKKVKKSKPLELAALELEEEPGSIRDIYHMAFAHPNADAEEIYHLLHADTKVEN